MCFFCNPLIIKQLTYCKIMTDQFRSLESQVREIYGRVVYTHKTHEKCSDILIDDSNLLKKIEIGLSAVTTTTILSVLFGSGLVFEIIAALCATASLCLTLYSKDFDLLGIAEKHKQSALEILALRERLLSLLVDIKIGNKSIDDLQKQRDEINIDLINTYRGAPKTNSKGYDRASKALKDNQEFTFTDAEIDLFLPLDLRRS